MRKQKVLAILVLLTMIMSLFTGCVVKEPAPTVEEGRFNFSVTYEVNGEEKVYSGVYVCKYEGVSVSIHGSGRMWSGYIENDKDNGRLAIQTNDEGVIYLAVHLSPDYFMADPTFEECGFETPAPNLALVHHSDDPCSSTEEGDLDWMGKYGVRIISWDYPEPIENSFEDKWAWGQWEWGIN